MPRTIDSATLTALQSDDFVITHLVKIDLQTPIYATENPFDIEYDGNNYLATEWLVSVGGVSESSELRVGQINLTLSGVDTTLIQTLVTSNIINKQVDIWKAIVNDETGALIGDPIATFRGYITTFGISESSSDSKITLSAASHWADFSKKNGRFTNNNSQQNVFPNDVGMQYSANTIKDLKWGNA